MVPGLLERSMAVPEVDFRRGNGRGQTGSKGIKNIDEPSHQRSASEVRERGGREGSGKDPGWSIDHPSSTGVCEKRKRPLQLPHLTTVTNLMSEVLDSVASICTR